MSHQPFHRVLFVPVGANTLLEKAHCMTHTRINLTTESGSVGQRCPRCGSAHAVHEAALVTDTGHAVARTVVCERCSGQHRQKEGDS